MIAYVIKNKEGKYFGVADNCNYEHYWTTLDFAHYFRYLEGHDAKAEAEEYRNTRYPDCQVVEVTIAEGDLEQQLAEKDNEINNLKELRKIEINDKKELRENQLQQIMKLEKELAEKDKEIKSLKQQIENNQRDYVSELAYYTAEENIKEIRKQVCEEIREECVYTAGTKQICPNTSISTYNLNEILAQIEKGE